MDQREITDRLTGEESEDDVPQEALAKAAEGDRHVDAQHSESLPSDWPITES